MDSPANTALGELSKELCKTAQAMGFARAAVLPLAPPTRYHAYQSWLDQNFHGEMEYLASDFHRSARADLHELLPSAKSVLAVAISHHEKPAELLQIAKNQPSPIARYALGRDYHQVIREKLYALAGWLTAQLEGELEYRVCVDTAPVLERDLAEAAGLGFIGKNTLLIVPGLGSYVFLAELLLSVELPPSDLRVWAPRCGSCVACLDACPTQAFVSEYVLDARRCISYWTIEHKGLIPREIRPSLGTMIFGCDLCQTACPYNQAAPARANVVPEFTADTRHATVDLLALAQLNNNQFKRYIKGSALSRVSRQQFLRNVAVALGNRQNSDAEAALGKLLRDNHPLVRAHAAWALGKISRREALHSHRSSETDPEVCKEIDQALADS